MFYNVKNSAMGIEVLEVPQAGLQFTPKVSEYLGGFDRSHFFDK